MVFVNFFDSFIFFVARPCLVWYTICCFIVQFASGWFFRGIKEVFFMANRVVVTICGDEYTFVAEESASYMQKVGAYVGDKMDEVLSSTHVGRTDAAVLTAVNIADELFKAQSAAEQLRRQIKGYLDDAGKAQSQVSELKREVVRLQQRLDSRGTK